MILAVQIDTNIIYLIGAAVYGVFLWLKGRYEKKQQEELEERIRREGGHTPVAPVPPPYIPPGAPAQPPPATGEEDRMRKFLEALGVPSSSAPAAPPPPPLVVAPSPRRATPPPLPRPQSRPGPHLPVPPIIAQRPTVRPGPPPRHPAARPLPVEIRPPLVLEEMPLESREPSSFAESATAVERITAAFERSHTISTHTPRNALSEGSPPVLQLEEQALNAQSRRLRELLHSPQDLKALLLAREILGPPKSLSDY